MVLVPEWVARNERNRQMLEQKASSHTQNADWKRWNELLRDIDPRLSYVFVPDIPHEDLPEGAESLRWHIVRVNEFGPDTYWLLETEDEEYREIGSRDLEDFKAGDLWNPARRHEIETARRRRKESKQRAKELRSEQHRDELTSLVNAIERPSIRVKRKPF